MTLGQYAMTMLSLFFALVIIMMAVELNDKIKEADEAHKLIQELRSSKAGGWNINF